MKSSLPSNQGFTVCWSVDCTSIKCPGCNERTCASISSAVIRADCVRGWTTKNIMVITAAAAAKAPNVGARNHFLREDSRVALVLPAACLICLRLQCQRQALALVRLTGQGLGVSGRQLVDVFIEFGHQFGWPVFPQPRVASVANNL